MTKKKILRAAVVGLGMGRGHVSGYHNYDRSEVAAICDKDEKRLRAVANEYGLGEECCFTDHQTMLARAGELELDAVSVATPNFLHAPITIDALKAGLHVLCEKPIASNAREGRKMIQAAEKAGRKLMVNFSYRFNDQSKALKQFVETGQLGDIYFGRTVWHRRWGMPGFGGWFGTKRLSGGGPVIDLGVHRLDLAMWLMGNPRPVTVSGGAWGFLGAAEAKRQGKTFDVEDLGCALIRFDNGATILLEASWAGFSEKKEDMSTQLFGTRGGLVQRNVGEGYQFEARVFVEHNGTIWNSELQRARVQPGNAYSEFVDACLDDREPIAPGRHGLDVQLILDAIYKSAEQGKEIRIPQGKK